MKSTLIENVNSGISFMDQQNRKLIQMMEEIVEKINKNEKKQEILNALQQLQEFAKEFFEEEEIMENHSGYGRLNEHHFQHAAFIKELENIRTACKKENKTQCLVGDVKEKMHRWIEHISNLDGDLGKFFSVKNK